MRYLLMLYSEEDGWHKLSQAEQEQWMADYAAFNEVLSKAGVLREVNRLQPSTTAATIRITEGQLSVSDGPYVDTNEQLGGYYILDVPDVDTAISWAARCPAARHGVIEVRPLGASS
jgi:hypothetical protein